MFTIEIIEKGTDRTTRVALPKSKLVYRIIDKQTKKQLQFMPFYGKIKETAVITWEDPKFIIYR